MEEESSDAMNLDLNLGPGPEPETGPMSNEAVNLDEWIGEPLQRISEAVRFRARQRWRWRHLPLPHPELHVHIPPEAARHFHIPPEAHNISMELNQFLVNSGNGTALQAGEGSVAAEERVEEVPKACENVNGVAEDEASQKKDDVEKGSGTDGDFFDCNICLDLSRDPVVTCCGHLFCWPCLYRWLHLHSDARECPVCKGEVTLKGVTPIYGRGNNVRGHDEDSALKIPPRPQARRVESLRQTIQRNAFTVPVEEMIRRIGSRIDLTRDFVHPHEGEGARETAERTTSLLSRFLTARGIRREQNLGPLPEDVMAFAQNNANNNNNTAEPGDNRNRVQQSHMLRRTQSHRATLSTLSALTSAERLLEAYFRSSAIARNQEQPSPPVDDRDSFSSIGAVINSESQVDTAVEIDSMVSLSTSSSRRRNDASRLSDVDSGDSRAPRRRRLN
ncbi:E3 ubiquitin-protein ligase RFWD3 [Vigna radiata var. radiata]|uniref:E3 ubiquitin-protein ligase RMA n=1 Tax=Vigna radiata var. radiata TaxID=3916 RepID=A0A1S3TR02_VIGRR|nr:E3 ubiquitin-protein ligase RFWD3 [Vigna radiata var. radiata]XP_022634771.1 E3 ubiquitin-protein ligase RFWD3 [Vigna radiata var. radiata]XP_022634772.1 E3 ubiquitin-protein ligase RFWD3 [Vigna radiata var. radiata]XP_022634773.1 E3 ubiquitin-protein ligase RFWD3 [Vigna radiata var. radiata]